MPAFEPLRIDRAFAAPVDALFRAWTDADILARWAWGSLGNNASARVDLREGGEYRVETDGPGGERRAFSGVYLEVVEPVRLVYTVVWSAPMGYESPGERVTVDFRARGEKSEVSFVHEGLPAGEAAREHARGWGNTFDHLDRILSRDARPE